MNYISIMLAEKSLGSRSDAELFGEFLGSADSDPRAFGRKSLYMILFFLQKALGDKQGHVNILMSRFLKTLVHLLLDKLPYCVAVGTYNHTALYTSVVDKVGFFYDVGIPFREVVLH